MPLHEYFRASKELKNLFEGQSKFLKPCKLIKYDEVSLAYRNFAASIQGYHVIRPPIGIRDDDLMAGEVSVYTYEERYKISPPRFNETILSFAKDACFGKGNETVYDENVRKALEIKAKDIIIKPTSVLSEAKMKKLIARYNPPGKMLVPKLYKMHLYEKGGFFLPHKDRLHSNDHYATLIIGLNDDFQGGEFVLNLDGQTESFRLGKNEGLLFMTDTMHEVKPVLSGIRATLQYDVLLKDADDSAIVEEDQFKFDVDDRLKKFYKRQEYPEKCISLQSLQKELLTSIQKYTDRHPDHSVSFLLSHMYPLLTSVDLLKGADRFFFETLSKEYEVDLGYVFHNFSGFYSHLQVMDSSMIAAFKNSVLNEDYTYEDKEACLLWNEDKNLLEEPTSVIFYGSKNDQDIVELREELHYYGNSSQSGEYVYCNFVLSIKSKK